MRNQHCTHPTVDSILIYILQLPRYPAPTNQPIAKSQSELQNQYMIAFAYNLHSATMNVSQMREKKTRFSPHHKRRHQESPLLYRESYDST